MARLSSADWLRAAAAQLAAGGVASVRVEHLAEALGVSKGSFYWHFKNRPTLLAEVAKSWERQGTLAVIEDVDRSAVAPADRLWALLERGFGAPAELDGLEAAIRDWASREPAIKTLVRRVDRRRLRYVAALLEDAGIDPDEAQRRAELLYCTMIGEFVQRSYGKPRLASAALRSLHRMLLRP